MAFQAAPQFLRSFFDALAALTRHLCLAFVEVNTSLFCCSIFDILCF
jgi:hypothetical protein